MQSLKLFGRIDRSKKNLKDHKIFQTENRPFDESLNTNIERRVSNVFVFVFYEARFETSTTKNHSPVLPAGIKNNRKNQSPSFRNNLRPCATFPSNQSFRVTIKTFPVCAWEYKEAARPDRGISPWDFVDGRKKTWQSDRKQTSPNPWKTQ